MLNVPDRLSVDSRHRLPWMSIRAAIFMVLSMALFVGDVLDMASLFPDSQLPLRIAVIAILCLVLGLSGMWPTVGGAVYMVLCVGTYFSPVHVALTSLGVYAIAALWLSLGWRRVTLAVLLATSIAELHTSSNPRASLIGILLGTSFAVLIGELLRFFREKHLADTMKVADLQSELENTSSLVRKEVAESLHDSALKDLSMIMLLSGGSGEESSGGPEMKKINDFANDANRKIRDILDMNFDLTPELSGSFEEVVALSRETLGLRRIKLDEGIQSLVSLPMNNSQRNLVAMVLREGCANVVKYAPAGSTCIMSADVENGSVHLSITSPMRSPNPSAVASNGGFGLRSLSGQATRLGGSLSHWVFQDNWVLKLELPVDNEEVGVNEGVS